MLISKNKRFLLQYSIVLSLTLSLSCNDKDDAVAQEITELVKSTMPSHAIMVNDTQIQINGNSVVGLWEFQSDGDWEQYVEWITNNLDERYRLITVEKSKVEFRRSSAGDVCYIEIENLSTDRLHVRVHFLALPD